MIYIFLGEDTLAKDKEIDLLKQKFLSSPEALRFDYEVLHAHKLTAEDLKKALISLPAIASQRLVVIRECHRLSAQNQQLVADHVSSQFQDTVLILESGQMQAKDAWIRALGKKIILKDFKSRVPTDVFDLTKAISLRNKTEALKILTNLLEEGIHPLQIMGALLWSWGNTRNRMSQGQFEGGLAALQNADLNIKRSRMLPEHAMEMLIVQLCSPEMLANTADRPAKTF